ncbi:MAG TPA: CBS domain-containing protein [Tepidisphaeraceae bacterium]|jgi:CBS domain-containing protein
MPTTLDKSLRADLVAGLKLRDVCSVKPSQSIKEVVDCMIVNRVGCALIVRDGQLVGIFTERDFLSRVVAQRLDMSQPVEKVMTPSPKTVRQRSSMFEAIELMGTDGYRHVPVLADNGEPLGVLSVKDIVHYLVEYFPANVYNLPPTPITAQPAREGA